MKNEVNQTPIDLRVPGLLREKHLLQIFRCGKSTLRRRISEGKFPSPLKDGHMSFWRNQDVLAYIEQLGANYQPYSDSRTVEG